MRAIIILSITSIAAVGRANIVVNGSFEADGEVSDATSLTGWNVISGNVDTRPSLLGGSAATDGTYLLDLEGSQPGAITQTIGGLIVGQTYQFSFDLGANRFDTALRFALSGAAAIDEEIGAMAGPLVTVRREFVASISEVTIIFIDIGGAGSNAGPALDNVILIPAPAASGLLALAGLAAARRRR